MKCSENGNREIVELKVTENIPNRSKQHIMITKKQYTSRNSDIEREARQWVCYNKPRYASPSSKGIHKTMQMEDNKKVELKGK